MTRRARVYAPAMRWLVGLGTLLAACGLLALGAVPNAHAARSEVQLTAEVVVPTPSDYRYSAEALGYGSRGIRPDFGAELAYLRGLTPWLSVGPVARFHAGRMSAPYDGLDALGLWGASLGVRAEADVFRYPRLFFWAEPALGEGFIGVADARKAAGYWEVRGGAGFGTLRDQPVSVRLRVGWSWAPTFSTVTAMAGSFNYGGLLFLLDGVFRVSR